MASSDVPAIVSCEWLKEALQNKSPGIKVLDVSWYSDKDAKQFYNEYDFFSYCTEKSRYTFFHFHFLCK